MADQVLCTLVRALVSVSFWRCAGVKGKSELTEECSKRMEPILETVAKDHFKNEIRIGKVDCTQESGLKARFNIKGFPTLEYFEDGEKSVPFAGGREVDSIAQWGARVLAVSLLPFLACLLGFSLTHNKSPTFDHSKILTSLGDG